MMGRREAIFEKEEKHMSKVIMSGNEAVARGCYEAGVHFAAAYPGTPSTEILENIGGLYKENIYAEWAPNEKVAAEAALGASIGGMRAICTFKHVGMNVAADPIFTAGYCGVNGGLVYVTADDPACHSSQNEQDNRLYAPHAKLAMIEASDSQECKDYIRKAYEISEEFDIPVLFRMTTRVCHSKSVVETGERTEVPVKPYVKDPSKYSMLPVNARKRHVIREDLLAKLEEYAYTSELNRLEEAAGADTGIITSGISYQYVKEVFGDRVSILKMGLTHPLSRKLLQEFASRYAHLIVVEEGEPYLENAVRCLGFTDITGKDKLTIQGEFNTRVVRDSLREELIRLGLEKPEEDGCEDSSPAEIQVPARPPVLCAGCPHRGFYYALSRQSDKFVSMGDIGCYALAVSPPLNGFDTCICMGAGFSTLVGLSRALKAQGDSRKAIGEMGDSTFFHSGITSLIDIVASETDAVAVILDNSITAMTGHQQNPGTTKNLMGYESPAISIEAVVRALGIDDDHLRIFDPVDQEAAKEALEAAYEAKGPFVIITKRPCALIKEVQKANAGKYVEIDPEKCVGCRQCMKIACPSLAFDAEAKKAYVADTGNCNQCGLCMQQCKFGAIGKAGE